MTKVFLKIFVTLFFKISDVIASFEIKHNNFFELYFGMERKKYMKKKTKNFLFGNTISKVKDRHNICKSGIMQKKRVQLMFHYNKHGQN